jgi:aminoglycoside phosphotransferase (APT) family kinase protein
MMDPFLNDDAALSGLDAGEKERLHALVPLLRIHCAELKLATLVHGDFHGGNIGCRNGALRFFDWTESCIAHPFFDLFVLLNDANRYFDTEAVAHLRDSYLRLWENSWQQWQIAAPLAAFHQALIYNGVAERLRPDAPRNRVAEWLRKILTYDA